MSGKVILWRRAGARRADIRRICLTKPQADIAGEMRDAGCESKLQTANCKLQTANCKLQTANCKQDRSMSCVVPPSKRASIGQPNHSKRASRPESLSFAFSSLPVFPSSRLPVFTSSRLHVFTSSRLHVFTSSRLHVFTSSRHRNFPPLEPFSNHSSDSTRPLIRPFAHIAHVAPLAPIAKPCPRPADPRRPPGVAASRNALGCERPEAVAPRHAARTP
ncbi:Uncharacterised protein [Burkholderia pseudomallei]|nr:Uncharacterised protein [Burkholderia pseudomallei]CAJ3811730.1 Uncharacterised protein [Burkholderia pseudomallei]CAJ4644204.1 Uncharacterised protein [Burkholderia pseudomallei]CAJ7295454.1 Uncharacterised protein [Burkholderia pseudomallei]CAJ7552428.1 Uncharacterised protein [Burkholderia pseudomallei]